jgi:methylmalonyl-CoA/ethylmalonyl-CoA epimerase
MLPSKSEGCKKFAHNLKRVMKKPLELPLDHIAIAVPSITAALPIFELLTNSASSPIERVETQKVDVAFVGSGAGRLELLQPAGTDSTVQKFLDKRGAGLHHIAYRVPDLAAALKDLAAAGVRLIDETPRPGAGGHLVAFLHPASTHGVLVELVEG